VVSDPYLAVVVESVQFQSVDSDCGKVVLLALIFCKMAEYEETVTPVLGLLLACA
jgi:hypothetical protein